MRGLEPTIDRIVRKTMDMDLMWDWPGGVAYYGVSTAYRLTKNEEYLGLLRARVDELIELGLPPWTVNACAMGHCLITLNEATGEQKYWDIVLSKAKYLQKDALRFGESVLQHTVSLSNDFPEQAWADTLFMAAFLLLRVGAKLEDTEMIKDALHQYHWHIRYLQDPEAALWYHGYDNLRRDHLSGFFWGRANAWAAYTASQVKPTLREWYLYPHAMDVECSLRDQLAALKLLQTENGLWRTVLNDPESYEEVSASCGIAAAMVENKNPLHKKYIEKALRGVLAEISEDGRVLGVSGGTAVMLDLEGYRGIPRTWTQGWGQGLALAFLTAVAAMQEDVNGKA